MSTFRKDDSQLVNREATTDGRDPDDVRAEQRADGNKLHASYIILSDDERAKGFVRPLFASYVHETCKTSTRMGQQIAETYARDPSFYGSTYCVHCAAHFPVGERGQFVWPNGTKVGT